MSEAAQGIPKDDKMNRPLDTGAATSLRQWEIENNVQDISNVGRPSSGDMTTSAPSHVEQQNSKYYFIDEEEQDALIERKPWKASPRYFTRVTMSACALIKLTMHARRGGHLEIMGLLQGKIVDDAFVVLDTFPLPVEGTETRVNAGAGANEYMINYQESNEAIGKKGNIVGWYHSHPGYGCWLSGIDCQTQTLYQQHQDPFVAIVIDPVKTCSAGKVEIGAFRCYLPGQVPPPDDTNDNRIDVPLNKVEDFGLHWKQYYKLPIDIFKTETDRQVLHLLWSHHWMATLASNPLKINKEYLLSLIQDVNARTECYRRIQKSAAGRSNNRTFDRMFGWGGGASAAHMTGSDGKQGAQAGTAISEIAATTTIVASEHCKGAATQLMKLRLLQACCCGDTASNATHQQSSRMDASA